MDNLADDEILQLIDDGNNSEIDELCENDDLDEITKADDVIAELRETEGEQIADSVLYDIANSGKPPTPNNFDAIFEENIRLSPHNVSDNNSSLNNTNDGLHHEHEDLYRNRYPDNRTPQVDLDLVQSNSGITLQVPETATPNEETNNIMSTCQTLDEAVKEYFVKHDLDRKKNISWRVIDGFETSNEKFFEPLESNITELRTPLNYFLNYLSNDFWQNTVLFTNLYAEQENIPHFSHTNVDEIKQFIGIHIIMGNLQYPRVRLYWEPKFVVPLIHDNMTRKRFQKLRTCIHFVDNTAKHPHNNDRFWKVRPLYDNNRNACQKHELEPNMCIDEQMVPFKGQFSAKQYIKNKPTKWGVKIFMLCGASGLTYDFILYQGSSTEFSPIVTKALGQGAAVVLQLSERIDKPNIHLYFDNFFNSYWLLQVLKQRDIYAAGTARIDRFAKPPFSSDKEVNKNGRGYIEEVVSSDCIILTKWNDNSIVNLASNFMGSGEVKKCKRWDKIRKEYVEIDQPEVVKRYNASMGGVDKMDFLISIYRTFIRSRKWTLRLFTHALDLAVTNAWLEYMKDASFLAIPKFQKMDLISFRHHVGEALIITSKPSEKKRGRPSSEQTPPPMKRQHVLKPLEDVRFDEKCHLPMFENNKNASRCKNANCKGKTYIFCAKCKIPLCIAREKNCFYEFHSK